MQESEVCMCKDIEGIVFSNMAILYFYKYKVTVIYKWLFQEEWEWQRKHVTALLQGIYNPERLSFNNAWMHGTSIAVYWGGGGAELQSDKE